MKKFLVVKTFCSEKCLENIFDVNLTFDIFCTEGAFVLPPRAWYSDLIFNNFFCIFNFLDIFFKILIDETKMKFFLY